MSKEEAEGLISGKERGDGPRWGRWLWLLALLGVFAAAIAWRWHFSSQAQIYTYDSYYYMVLGRNLRSGLDYSVAGHAHLKFLPLYPMTIAFFNLFIPNLEFVGKFSNVFFTSACVFPIYAIGKLIFSRRAGMAAALLFAFEPITVVWSSIPMSEGLFTFLVCIGAFFFLHWMKKGRRGALYLCAVTVGLATITRWEGFFFLALIGIFMLYYWWKGRLKISHLALFSVIALAPFALWVIRNLVVFGTPVKSAYLSELDLHPEQFEAFNAWGRLRHYLEFSDIQTIGISERLYNFGYLLIGYGGLILALVNRRRRSYAAFLTGWLLVMGPVHFFWYFLSVRFLFPAVPALCLGGGALLGVPWSEELWEKGKRTAAVFLSLLAVSFIAVLAIVGRPVTNDMFVRNVRYLEDDTGGLAAKDALLWLKDSAGEVGVASSIGPITSFYLGRDALFLGPWQGFEDADIRPDHLLEDAHEKGVRYIVVYAWEPDVDIALEYAGVDPNLLSELRVVDEWFVAPQVEGNLPIYAYVLEVPSGGP